MNAKPSALWLHRFAAILSGCTLFLIFVGGMVTSTQSGLSVPDWPLSYGRLMPPMIGGIFYEHGHRMVAATIGFLTVLLAVAMTLNEERRWLKRAAWGALGLVIFQGVLGGLTVIFRLPKPISIAHACSAQTFLSLVTAIAVWTSPTWNRATERRVDTAGKLPLHHITTGLFIALYIQLILGAILRHTGSIFVFHVSGALMSFTLGAMAFKRTRNESGVFQPLNLFAGIIIGVLFLQFLLGLASYILLTREFNVIPVPLFVPILVSLHVVTGAFLLAASAVLALLANKTKPLDTPTIKTKFSDYFELTKPGISMMAGITAVAGFIMGSGATWNLAKLFHTAIGTLLIAGGAGTLNMLIEKDSDAQMKRTSKRPLPSGRMRPGEALLFGSLLAGIAIAYLACYVNLLTAVTASLAFSVYLYVYTPLKKISSLCTLAGAVAGALPPVIGWTAATGKLGPEAWVLFGILFFWQFPHFFALAWLYKDDYALAGFNMLPRPNDHGTTTAISMVINSLALLIVSCMPTFMGLTGYFYLAAAILTGGWLLVTSTMFFFNRSRGMAKQIFFASLAYVPVLVTFMVLNK